jgi:hypothetical protein
MLDPNMPEDFYSSEIQQIVVKEIKRSLNCTVAGTNGASVAGLILTQISRVLQVIASGGLEAALSSTHNMMAAFMGDMPVNPSSTPGVTTTLYPETDPAIAVQKRLLHIDTHGTIKNANDAFYIAVVIAAAHVKSFYPDIAGIPPAMPQTKQLQLLRDSRSGRSQDRGLGGQQVIIPPRSNTILTNSYHTQSSDSDDSQPASPPSPAAVEDRQPNPQLTTDMLVNEVSSVLGDIVTHRIAGPLIETIKPIVQLVQQQAVAPMFNPQPQQNPPNQPTDQLQPQQSVQLYQYQQVPTPGYPAVIIQPPQQQSQQQYQPQQPQQPQSQQQYQPQQPQSQQQYQPQQPQSQQQYQPQQPQPSQQPTSAYIAEVDNPPSDIQSFYGVTQPTNRYNQQPYNQQPSGTNQYRQQPQQTFRQQPSSPTQYNRAPSQQQQPTSPPPTVNPSTGKCPCCGFGTHAATACEYIRSTGKFPPAPNIDTLSTLTKSESDAIVTFMCSNILMGSTPEFLDNLVMSIDTARAGRLGSAAKPAAPTASTVAATTPSRI